MTPAQSQRYGFRLLEILFGGFLAIAIVFLMKDIEIALLPVVENFEVHQATKVTGGVELRGTMQKARSCTFNDMIVYVDTNDNRYPIVADYNFHETAKLLRSRAPIEQEWGPWTIFIPYEFENVNVQVYTSHRCHALYLSHTKVADVDLRGTENTNLEIVNR